MFLCPVIFNIFLYDFFLIGKDKDIVSFADDSAAYCTSNVPDAAKVCAAIKDAVIME